MIIDAMDGESEEIRRLLQDICEYLNRKKRNSGTLSVEEINIVEDLIDRSKRQIQKIEIEARNKIQDSEEEYDVIDSKITDDSRYVDMGYNKSIDNVPPPLPKKTLVTPPKTPSETICPYNQLPAIEVSRKNKNGALLIRRKLFIIERSTKVYGAVHDNWLLLYWSNKMAKPFCALDLKRYVAKENEPDATSAEPDIARDRTLKKPCARAVSGFKVFETNNPNAKFYNFIATTHKDMLQWVTKINRSHDNAVGVDEENNYEPFDDPSTNVEDGEDIYCDIDNSLVTKPSSSIDVHPKTCPPTDRLDLASADSIASSVDDIYEELVSTNKNHSIKNSLDSFEESSAEDEEDDAIYFDISASKNEREKESNSYTKGNVKVLRNIIKAIPKKLQRTSKDLSALPLDKTPSKTTSAESDSAIIQVSAPETPAKTKQVSPSSNLVKITRPRLASTEHTNLETFSRNSKTFQASPIKKIAPINFDVPTSSTSEIGVLQPTAGAKANKNKGDDEKPMVLLKPSFEDADTLRKTKKYPVLASKPKLLAKKTQL